jgi:hypothetical protein
VSKADHVIWDNSVEGTKDQLYPAYRFRCTHCGDVYDMAVPCPLALMGAVMKAFMREHRYCEPRPPAPPESP